MLTKEEISKTFLDVQEFICLELENEDGFSKFQTDNWLHHSGGGGKSKVIQNGNVFEKGGVNYSAVKGKTPEKLLSSLGINNASENFYATGISIVMHPKNPFNPIIHMNVRYFEMSNGMYWFGGGIDLTPIYFFEEEAKFFHQSLKSVCDSYSKESYTTFKNWADDYFFINHRSETRGIGGIFFDRLNSSSSEGKLKIFEFVHRLALSFAPTYKSIIQQNKNREFSKKNLEWQFQRRGRYVEFNLVYDKGTQFGLETGGRTESILMSLPPMATWQYQYQVTPHSHEERTQNMLKKKIDFINL